MIDPRFSTATYCHSRTVHLAWTVAEADVLIAAVGRPELIKGAWIKPGTVVIDAGYNPGNVGDVEYRPAAQRARLITPVPSGVGPTTIAVLIHQTVAATVMHPGRSSAPVVRVAVFAHRVVVLLRA
jgi:methylenetetrahydrofolate dehydrogenase (NADP+)/methenyltetrahydrofolate cyclohydrolase